jgi:hypothetical protein
MRRPPHQHFLTGSAQREAPVALSHDHSHGRAIDLSTPLTCQVKQTKKIRQGLSQCREIEVQADVDCVLARWYWILVCFARPRSAICCVSLSSLSAASRRTRSTGSARSATACSGSPRPRIRPLRPAQHESPQPDIHTFQCSRPPGRGTRRCLDGPHPPESPRVGPVQRLTSHPGERQRVDRSAFPPFGSQGGYAFLRA